MELRDKVIWVTGASSGIGEALACALAARGARLILSARRVERLDAVRERCGAERARVLRLDLADSASFPDAVHEAEQLFGGIDVLVNNAGVSQRALFAEMEPAVIRRLVEVDLLGPVLLSRAVLLGMIERQSGHLLFVGSVWGKLGLQFRTVYAACKHALYGFADSLRAEVWKDGIGVTAVAAGFVRTELSLNALRGDGRPHGTLDEGMASGISADRCAAAIVRALERERREVLVRPGVLVRLALILRIVAPGLLARLLRRRWVT
jgi:short-subunit dehydrogenase